MPPSLGLISSRVKSSKSFVRNRENSCLSRAFCRVFRWPCSRLPNQKLRTTRTQGSPSAFLLPYGLGWFVGALILTPAGPLFTTHTNRRGRTSAQQSVLTFLSEM